jgi:hypothetical protein
MKERMQNWKLPITIEALDSTEAGNLRRNKSSCVSGYSPDFRRIEESKILVDCCSDRTSIRSKVVVFV